MQEAALQTADRLARLKASGEGTPVVDDFVKDRYVVRAATFHSSTSLIRPKSSPTTGTCTISQDFATCRLARRRQFVADNKTLVNESADLDVRLHAL